MCINEIALFQAFEDEIQINSDRSKIIEKSRFNA
jgi:hypothetical protein